MRLAQGENGVQSRSQRPEVEKTAEMEPVCIGFQAADALLPGSILISRASAVGLRVRRSTSQAYSGQERQPSA